MDDFKNFLKENNYEGDLEFQLCDLGLAFNEGKKLKWKPSDKQMFALNIAIEMEDGGTLKSLYDDLMKLKKE